MDVEVESVASALTENSNGAGYVGVEKNAPNLKKNRIQVSNKKKPLFFYVNLAKRYMQQHEEVELSALGMEILTSSIGMKDETRGRTVQKAKIEIVLAKSENFDELMITSSRTPEVAAEEKN